MGTNSCLLSGRSQGTVCPPPALLTPLVPSVPSPMTDQHLPMGAPAPQGLPGTLPTHPHQGIPSA